MSSRKLRALAVSGAVLVSLAACLVPTQRVGDLAPRYASVHNAFVGMGLSEVGALRQGRIEPGQETRIDLDLGPGCTTILALSSGSVQDLDAALMDSAGARVAHGATGGTEATLRVCVEQAGSYVLVLRSPRGSGEFIVSMWAGGAPAEGAPAGNGRNASQLAEGTCDEPLELSAGEFRGDTRHGDHQNEPKGCAGGSAQGPEVVYKLEDAARQKVTISVEGDRLDAVTYIRKGSCTDQDAEVACNDDAPAPNDPNGSTNSKYSRVEDVLDAGTYYVFVDSYNEKTGTYQMKVELSDVPSLAEVCNGASILADGATVSGTLDGAFDDARSSCGDEAKGPDVPYSLSLPKRSRVRLVEHSEDFAPVVHARAHSTYPESDIGCSETGAAEHDAAFLALLDAGTYTVFADTAQNPASGKFTLSAETAPEQGLGVRGDSCGDALPLRGSDHTLSGDTFAAKDDLAGRCGGTGAPDVVYRLDLATRSRFTAHVATEEGKHVLILLHGCGAQRTELECGTSIDRVVPPGSYFMAVDGKSPAGFGRFTVEWATRDAAAQDSACRAAPLLQIGHAVTGTTTGGADRFTPRCASRDGATGSPDAVYKIVLPSRERVRIDVGGLGWGQVVSVRRSCLEDGNDSDIACSNDSGPTTNFDVTLDAGIYYVVVDGQDGTTTGPFTLTYDVAPPGSAPPPPMRRGPHHVRRVHP